MIGLDRRSFLLSILGWAITETVASLLWFFLGISGLAVQLATIGILSVAWIMVYLVVKPKNSLGRNRKEESDQSVQSSVKLLKVWIIPNKKKFKKGELLFFRMRFKGTLSEGYRAAQATFEDGLAVPIYDRRTLADLYSKGTLDGPQNFDERWPWIIPSEAVSGPCSLFIAPCTTSVPVTPRMKLKRFPLRLLDSGRVDLAKPLRQAVDGRWRKIEVE